MNLKYAIVCVSTQLITFLLLYTRCRNSISIQVEKQMFKVLLRIPVLGPLKSQCSAWDKATRSICSKYVVETYTS